MSNHSFKVGDVVYHKSFSGLKLTIHEFLNAPRGVVKVFSRSEEPTEFATCIYMNTISGLFIRETFRIEELTKP